VTFVMQVDPGRRVYVRNINISGNSKTRDEVIRREMRQLEASWYNLNSIKRSRNRIDRLGYFKEVGIDVDEVLSSPDLVDVNVKVEERPLGSISLGIGFSSSEDLVISGSLSQQNFMGTGTSLSLAINSSKVNETFSITHLDPYWTDEGISRSLQVYTRKYEADELIGSNKFSVTSQGLGSQFGIPISEEGKVFVGGSFVRSSYGGVRTLWPSRVQAEVTRFGKTSLDAYLLSIGWLKDTRDSGIAPTLGRQQNVGLDYATPIGTLEYARLNYGDQYFRPLTRAVTLALKGEIGWGAGLGGKDFPTLSNYTIGGIGSVRGFSGGGIGTRDSDGSSLGGNRKLVFNSELLVPLPGMAQDRTIRAFTFFDTGAVWQEREKVDFADLRASIGIGLSWLSPVGPLKLSMGSAVRKEAGDQTQRFQFQIGTGF